MPIHINLLAEVQAEEESRRRDPVKRAIFVGALLVALTLVWFSSVWAETKMTLSKQSRVDDELQAHTNEYAQVQINLKRVADGQHRLAALEQIRTNRFLQGNLLNGLQKVYVPNVQLTRMRLEQTYVVKDGVPAKTNSFGVVAGRPGTSTEKIVLTLDAKDTSSNPGDQVNHYKDTLAQSAYFKLNLNTNNGIRLLNLSPPQISAAGKPFVLFTLECRYTDKTR